MENIPNENQLFKYAREIEGGTLYTLKQKKPFFISVASGNLEITPETGNPRILSRADIAEVLAELKRSGSLFPGHYSKITFNVSYILALVRTWQNQ